MVQCFQEKQRIIRELKTKLLKVKTIIFKPKIDSRVNRNYISTHNNNKYKAFIVSDENEILNKSKKYIVIGIDEAQFNNSLVDM